ncbi:Phosphoribosylformylglycinamidine synthase [Erysipelothrix inopinata]
MGRTIITERFSNYNHEGRRLVIEATNYLKLQTLKSVRILHVFEIENANSFELDTIKNQIFKEPIGIIYDSVPSLPRTHFKIKHISGQYDFIEDQVEEMVHTMLGFNHISITHSLIYSLESITYQEFEIFRDYIVNPLEMELVTEDENNSVTNYAENETLGLGMDQADLDYVFQAFESENRVPNQLELKIIDTYWSDHCRHTTFNTVLDDVSIEGTYTDLILKSWNSYLETRKYLNRTKPITLMDLATINAKEIKKKGFLEDWDISEEVNAASINVTLDNQETLLLFKNETHNHPTEVEPYGGASTCIGGGVRDPLSGRGYAYQAMRISGSKNPTLSYKKTHPLKLSSRKICQDAALGYTDYLNQMGIDGGYVKEYYHDGFEAKRLELGALIAAVPKEDVQKSIPELGDCIILIGGRTGRDGLGAAVGSSSASTKRSLSSVGAEVQKGNPVLERKIVRLFKRPEFLKRIKRCNDFGAGGVSVAVGELAESLRIYLDRVPLKYPGLSAEEIALSESQERMAIVVAKDDVEFMFREAFFEDLEATVIAEVTDTQKLEMFYDNSCVAAITRNFLDSNGVSKHQNVLMQSHEVQCEMDPLNKASQRGLREQFNGQYLDFHNNTPQLGMMSYIPLKDGYSSKMSLMTHGYNPFIAESSPYHSGYVATIDAITKIVAMGGSLENIRLSYQEYFEKLTCDESWGKPLASLLGAFEVMKALDIPALGGKDSMSGTFEELMVPPTLLCFAIQVIEGGNLVSRSLKSNTSTLILVNAGYSHETLLDIENYRSKMTLIHKLMNEQKILSASTVTTDIKHEVLEMTADKLIGVAFEENLPVGFLPGSLILEVENLESLKDLDYQIIGKTLKKMEFNQQPLRKQIDMWEKPLSEIYQTSKWRTLRPTPKDKADFELKNDEACSLLIPILPGMTGDLELEMNLKALSIHHEFIIIQTNDYEASIDRFVNKIENHNTLFLCDGYKMVNTVFNSGTQISVFLSHPKVKKSLEMLISRKGLIIGSGAGFVGLINHNYFGDDIKVYSNPHHKFMHRDLKCRVVSDENALFQNQLGNHFDVSLNAFYSEIEVQYSFDKVFLEATETLSNQPMVIGMHAAEGRIIGTLCQIENNKSLLAMLFEYFIGGK